MSHSQSSGDVSRPARRKLRLVKAGIALLAASCAVLLVMSAMTKVQDAADRIH
jgi:hypothetical protein